MESFRKFVVILAISTVLICKVRSEEIEIEEDETKTISCRPNHEIFIQSSQSSWRWRNPLTTPTACIFGGFVNDMSEKVKELCNALGVCAITPTRRFFGYQADYRRFLKVNYGCHPYTGQKAKNNRSLRVGPGPWLSFKPKCLSI